jgi:hypothetical protein
MPQRIVLKSVASSSQTTVTLTAAKRLDPALFER